MEKKTYVSPSQKARKIRVQSMLAGSTTTGDNVGGGLSLGGPANPRDDMMVRKRTSID